MVATLPSFDTAQTLNATTVQFEQAFVLPDGNYPMIVSRCAGWHAPLPALTQFPPCSARLGDEPKHKPLYCVVSLCAGPLQGLLRQLNTRIDVDDEYERNGIRDYQ